MVCSYKPGHVISEQRVSFSSYIGPVYLGFLEAFGPQLLDHAKAKKLENHCDDVLDFWF